MPSHLRLAFSLAVRIVCLTFAVMAAFCIPEARKYLRDDVVGQDDVVFMPLTICKPSTFEFDGALISFDTNDAKGCHVMTFLANSCAMSLVFSILALAVFGLADYSAQRGRSRVPGAVVGMGLFLVFILLQTAVTTWALGSESRFWENYYQTILADIAGSSGYKEMRMHGDSMMLIFTGSMAVLCALVMGVETLLMYWWPYSTERLVKDLDMDADPSETELEFSKTVQETKHKTQLLEAERSILGSDWLA